MTRVLLIALGGGLGSVLRYLLGGAIQKWFGSAPAGETASIAFPVGTLAVNTLGCLAIGMLSVLFAGSILKNEDMRFMLIVGVLGGFTTFSAFSLETVRLFGSGQAGWGALYVLLSNALCLGGAWLGALLARWLWAVPA